MKDISALLAKCRKSGMRTTPQRIMIFKFLAGNTMHPTADEIFETVKKTYPCISVATVYNTLNMLASMGEINQLSAGGTRRFDPDTKPHDHAVCQKCGKLFDVPGKKNTETELTVSIKKFMVTSKQTIYYGICQECVK